MGFVPKVGPTSCSSLYLLICPPDQRFEAIVGQIIEAETIAQRMAYILAGALSASAVGMVIVWSLHASIMLTCM